MTDQELLILVTVGIIYLLFRGTFQNKIDEKEEEDKHLGI
jgi:hypothetical protein